MKTIIITILLIGSQALAAGKINFHNMIEDSVRTEKQLKKQVTDMIHDSENVKKKAHYKRVADKSKTSFSRELDSLQK